MSALVALRAASSLTGPAVDPLSANLSALAIASDRLSGALILGRLPDLPRIVADAKRALDAIECHERELLVEVSPATADEIGDALEQLVQAFPDGSAEDQAGYGAQLAADVRALRPSRRALRLGCEDVRLHRHYTRLPAIGTTWEAIRAADDEVRGRMARIVGLPERIARAEAMLGRSRPALAAGGTA